MNNIAILLTACINPNGMSFTSLQNSHIRQKQYIDALNFYLKNTKYNICIVENTNVDLSYIWGNYIDKGRLEYFTFNGNNYNKDFGKGYGEAIIIKYAFKHSKILKNSRYVIKITGRLIIDNINLIINDTLYKVSSNIIRFNYLDHTSIYTMCFICPTKWLANHMETLPKHINDSHGKYLEYVLYNIICTSKLIIIPFFTSPNIIGISGTTSKKYNNKSTLHNILDNLHYLSLSYKMQNKRIKYYLVKSIYYYYILLSKLLKFYSQSYN